MPTCRTSQATCLPCTALNVRTLALVGLGLLCALLVLWEVLRRVRERLPGWYRRGLWLLAAVANKLKILVRFYQITTRCGEMPSKFATPKFSDGGRK